MADRLFLGILLIVGLGISLSLQPAIETLFFLLYCLSQPYYVGCCLSFSSFSSLIQYIQPQIPLLPLLLVLCCLAVFFRKAALKCSGGGSGEELRWEGELGEVEEGRTVVGCTV